MFMRKAKGVNFGFGGTSTKSFRIAAVQQGDISFITANNNKLQFL